MTAAPSTTWQPSVGAWIEGDGVRFRVWASNAREVSVRIEDGDGGEPAVHPLEPQPDGTHAGHVRGIGAGARYKYVLDGDAAYPDPASRYQPEGVHGPSQVVDPSAYAWSDGEWNGIRLAGLVTYELHVGTFTPEGTFEAAARALPALVELGVRAVQLMPLADFPGERGWGYDGVCQFAPARCYGTPDGLRALVDEAHRLGLGVILDVVYNHFGPDGAYQGAYSKDWYTDRHKTPWGSAINLDGPGSEHVRGFFIESALHWLHEYHADGFRLDATHALYDDRPTHFLAEYAERIQGAVEGKRPLMIVEDHRNEAGVLHPRPDGYGIDAVLADDLHHEVRRLLAGDHEGYYADYEGTTRNIALAIQQGWTFTGAHSQFWDEPRGTDPAGIPPPRFVHCIQNHDQVGNRALGERLHHQVPHEAYRAASALLLLAPETPMLFMGQEWASESPFQFFTDHNEELGRLVTEGRRNEFKAWSAFNDPAVRERIPDPQARATFERSKLDWPERERQPHASMLAWYRALLALRNTEGALAWDDTALHLVSAYDDDTVVLVRSRAFQSIAVVVRLRGAGEVTLAPGDLGDGRASLSNLGITNPGVEGRVRWIEVLNSEHAQFATDPQPVEVTSDEGGVHVRFARPGAVVLRAAPAPA